MSNSPWHDKTMGLVRKHNLGFIHNPGGGQFVNQEKGINVQVFAWDDKEDYETLLLGLQRLGIEESP